MKSRGIKEAFISISMVLQSAITKNLDFVFLSIKTLINVRILDFTLSGYGIMKYKMYIQRTILEH